MAISPKFTSLFLVTAFLLSTFVCLDCSFANDYLEMLQQQAKEQKLANSREWLRLLHYTSGGSGLFKSVFSRAAYEGMADDSAFYLSKSGKYSPESELYATLKAFFVPQSKRKGFIHPQCRFIARYHWLKHRLKFDSDRLLEINCPEFEKWLGAIAAEKITLIFPAAFLNNPPSMFGHTLLRFDPGNADNTEPLLSYAVNYGAVDTGPPGFVYAVKGIGGWFQGLFSINPYYDTVKTYNDIENRDIWEYELSFSKRETKRVLMHLWELRSIKFDYYFFSENCSYLLLSLLEVGRPELELTSQFSLWVIPSETVRVIAEEPGLVTRRIFRPSRSTKLNFRSTQISSKEKNLVAKAINYKLPLPSPELHRVSLESRARVFELGFELLEYRRLTGQVEPDVIRARAYELLRKRSEQSTGQIFKPLLPPRIGPDEGHLPGRVKWSFGIEAGKGFSEVSLRPAYHALLDPEGGYVKGSQLEMMDVTLRFAEGDGAELERVKVLDVWSLVPRRDFLKPVSWKLQLGAIRKFIASGHKAMIGVLNGGAGMSWEIDSDLLSFNILELLTEQSSHYVDSIAFGYGYHTGIFWDLSPAFRTLLDGEIKRFELGERHIDWRIGLRQRGSLSRNLSIEAEVSFQEKLGASVWTTSTALNLFF